MSLKEEVYYTHRSQRGSRLVSPKPTGEAQVLPRRQKQDEGQNLDQSLYWDFLGKDEKAESCQWGGMEDLGLVSETPGCGAKLYLPNTMLHKLFKKKNPSIAISADVLRRKKLFFT